MLALTLHQPHALLVVSGDKGVETRSWRTNVRGLIAIHASVGFPEEFRKKFYLQHFNSALSVLGYKDPDYLPKGVILGTVELVDCRPTTEIRDSLSEKELAFGNYDDGRFAFILRNHRRLASPIPARGAFKFWNYRGEISI